MTERDRFVVMRGNSIYIPKAKGRCMLLADSNIVKHVMREYAVSVFASAKGSRFVCFDIDNGGIDAVNELRGAIEQTGVDRSNIHISFSGKKGYHVEIFFDDVVEHAYLIRFCNTAMNAMKIDTSKIECRPTIKSAIKLPLSVHHATGRTCWFLDQGSLLEIESYDYIHGIRPMNAECFCNLVDGLEQEPIENSKPVGLTLQRGELVEELSVAIDDLPALTVPGSRHNHTLNLAVLLRSRGIPADACIDILLHWISKQDRALYSSSEHEIFSDTQSIVKWAYNGLPDTYTKSSDQVSVAKGDMQRVMTHRSKTERKIFFLLLFNRCYKRPLRQEDIAAMLGVSCTIVRRVIARMVASNELITDAGANRLTRSGHICKQRNRYNVLRQELTGEQKACWKTDLYFHSFPLPESPEAFLAAYHGTIHAMFQAVNLKKHLSAQEYSEYLGYVSSLHGCPTQSDIE